MSQGAADIQIAVKRQAAKGSPESGSGATGYDVVPTQGLKLNKAKIPNEIVRRDRMSRRDGHGSRSSGAVYGSKLSVGTFNDWIEATFRGTVVAQATITEATASLTSITTPTTSTIVAGAGSWITAGVRKFDKVKLTGHATAANNGKWFIVTNVTASTITVAGTPLVVDAVADTAFTLTVAKKITNGAVERYHTVEDYEQTDDESLLGTDMKIVKMEFSAQPNKDIDVTFTFMGLDAQPQDSATAPVLTSPTYSTTLPIKMVDGTIHIGGVEQAALEGFSFVLDLGGEVPPGLSPVSVDVYLANAKVSGTFSAFKTDLTFLNAFDAETQLDFVINCEENEADPVDFVLFAIPNATLDDYASAIAASGPRRITCPWSAGIDESGGAADSTMIKMCTSV